MAVLTPEEILLAEERDHVLRERGWSEWADELDVKDLCVNDGKWDWLDDGPVLSVSDEPTEEDRIARNRLVDILEDRDVMNGLASAVERQSRVGFLNVLCEASKRTRRWQMTYNALLQNQPPTDEFENEVWKMYLELDPQGYGRSEKSR